MYASKFGKVFLLAGIVALPAAADDVYYDTARVLSVTPQTERINTPRQECHTEYVRDSSYETGGRGIGGAIIGGIAGGLLGSQIGKGNGRVAGAAVGAATGAIVGDRIDNGGRRDYTRSSHPVEQCVTVDDWQTVNRGYLVTYRYHGREYTTTMPRDPGRNIKVRVAIAPEYDSDRTAYLAPGNDDAAYDDDDRHDVRRHRDWD